MLAPGEVIHWAYGLMVRRQISALEIACSNRAMLEYLFLLSSPFRSQQPCIFQEMFFFTSFSKVSLFQ